MKIKIIIAALIIFSLGYFLICSNKSYAGSFEGSEVIGSNVAHDASMFPALSSMTDVASLVFITSTPAIVYGLHITSPTTLNNYIVFFDTEGIPTSNTVSTKTAIAFPTSNGNQNLVIQLVPPLRFNRGVVTRSTACGTTLSGWCYTVMYDNVRNRRP